MCNTGTSNKWATPRDKLAAGFMCGKVVPVVPGHSPRFVYVGCFKNIGSNRVSAHEWRRAGLTYTMTYYRTEGGGWGGGRTRFLKPPRTAKRTRFSPCAYDIKSPAE